MKAEDEEEVRSDAEDARETGASCETAFYFEMTEVGQAAPAVCGGPFEDVSEIVLCAAVWSIQPEQQGRSFKMHTWRADVGHRGRILQ